MGGIIALLVLVAVGYLYFSSDPKWLKQIYKGKNDEQKKVIRYFLRKGLLARIMKDEEYDELVTKKVASLNIQQKALDKHGLDIDQVKEIPPVVFEGYIFDKAYSKKGKDNLWRSSRYQVSCILFSDSQVYFYQYTFNFDDISKKETTDEYFYKDIVNFSTTSETEEVELLDQNGKKTGEEAINTTKFQMVVPGDKVSCALEHNKRNDNGGDFETIIKAMKNKLREKKS